MNKSSPPKSCNKYRPPSSPFTQYDHHPDVAHACCNKCSPTFRLAFAQAWLNSELNDYYPYSDNPETSKLLLEPLLDFGKIRSPLFILDEQEVGQMMNTTCGAIEEVRIHVEIIGETDVIANALGCLLAKVISDWCMTTCKGHFCGFNLLGRPVVRRSRSTKQFHRTRAMFAGTYKENKCDCIK